MSLFFWASPRRPSNPPLSGPHAPSPISLAHPLCRLTRAHHSQMAAVVARPRANRAMPAPFSLSGWQCPVPPTGPRCRDCFEKRRAPPSPPFLPRAGFLPKRFARTTLPLLPPPPVRSGWPEHHWPHQIWLQHRHHCRPSVSSTFPRFSVHLSTMSHSLSSPRCCRSWSPPPPSTGATQRHQKYRHHGPPLPVSFHCLDHARCHPRDSLMLIGRTSPPIDRHHAGGSRATAPPRWHGSAGQPFPVGLGRRSEAMGQILAQKYSFLFLDFDF
jgi:hypothetical protein